MPCSVGIGLDFQSLKVNSRTSQIPLISLMSCSIFNCLSAPSVISKTSTFSEFQRDDPVLEREISGPLGRNPIYFFYIVPVPHHDWAWRAVRDLQDDLSATIFLFQGFL